MSEAAVDIGVGVIGFEPDRVAIVGYGAVIVALALVGDAAVAVGGGAVVGAFALILDDPRAASDAAFLIGVGVAMLFAFANPLLSKLAG